MTLYERMCAKVDELNLAEYHIQIEGNHVRCIAIADFLGELSPLKRQQLIIRQFKDFVATNEIHAVHVLTFTEAKWQEERHKYAL